VDWTTDLHKARGTVSRQFNWPRFRHAQRDVTVLWTKLPSWS